MTAFKHTWIEQKNAEQLQWIKAYLTRYEEVLPEEGSALASITDRDALIAFFDSNMNDPGFRERYRNMQAAWRQQRLRRQPDRRSMTFHLHRTTSEQLGKLAKKRKQTQIAVLENVIQNAWNAYAPANKQIRDQAPKDKKNADQQATEALLGALAKNMNLLCRWRATLEESDPPSEDVNKEVYQKEVDSSLAALEEQLEYLEMPELVNTLRQRMDKLTPSYETTTPESLDDNESV